MGDHDIDGLIDITDSNLPSPSDLLPIGGVSVVSESISDIDSVLESRGMLRSDGSPSSRHLNPFSAETTQWERSFEGSHGTYKRFVNSLGSHSSHNEDYVLRSKMGDLTQTGIPDIDEILSLPTFRLSPGSTLVRMWGCKRCWYRGTDMCPFGIDKDQTHANGYCDMAIREKLVMTKSMGTTKGMKFNRNVNIIHTMNMLDFYKHKLMDISSRKGASKLELELLDRVQKMQDRLNEHLAKAIKQDEGTRVQHTSLKASDINKLLFKAKTVKDVTTDEGAGERDEQISNNEEEEDDDNN